MAIVYLAHHVTLDRAVAFKILKPELAVDRAYVARFHREAQAAAALVQANIVQIYEVGETDGLHFIAQEYVRGQNLHQYLNRHQVVEPILAVSIMRQVGAALNKAAEHGVIHRDIKPENIMLAPNGEVKVTDFGLARVADDKRSDLTQIGIAMGTPLYMSPEQAEGRKVDSRSDLYSLGITAWHMLAGRPPFEGETALSIAVQHVKQDLPPLNQIRPDLPADLCAVVHRLAEKNPEDRFQNPQQLVRQLRSLDFDDIADWELLHERLAVDDTTPLATNATVIQSHLEVTRQLQTIMRGHFIPWWRSTRLLACLGVIALIGAVAGTIFALSRPPLDPFSRRAIVDNKIEKLVSAEEQYYAAMWITDPLQAEQAWKAVRQYFPTYDENGQEIGTNLLYARKADVRLGALYLQTGQYEKAESVFEQLAGLEETEEELRLIGIAGQAIVYDHTNERQRVTRLLPVLYREIDKIAGFMGDETRALLEKYRAAGLAPAQLQ
jgi:serine/threonine-protein kinase